MDKLLIEIFFFKILCYVTLIPGYGFPIHQFLNKPSEVDLSAYLCQTGNPNKCCDCHLSCMEEKTCCIDYLWSENNTSLDQYLEHFVNESKNYKDLNCETIFPPEFTSKSYLMVTTCSQQASAEIVQKCVNGVDKSNEFLSPVIGSDSYLYKNSYCAECNFLTEFQRVNVSGFCTNRNQDTNGQINVFQKYTSCEFDIDRAGPHGLTECTTSNRTCTKGNPVYDLCKSYKGMVGNFENYHCFRCNNKSYSVGSFYETKHSCDGEIPPGRRYGWSVTISYGSRTKASVINLHSDDEDFLKHEEFTLCDEGKQYDMYSAKCKPFVCAHGYDVSGASCVRKLLPEVVYVENPQFDTCLLSRQPVLYIEAPTQFVNVTNLQKIFEQYLNTSNEHLLNHSATGNQTILRREKAVTKADLDNLVLLSKDPFSKLWLHVYSIYVTSVGDQPLTELYKFDISRTFPNQRICAKPSPFPASVVNFTSSCGIFVNNETIDWYNVSSHLTFTSGGIQQNVSTCHQFHLHSSCKLTTIEDNVTIVKNYTLILETSTRNYSFDVDQYIPLTNGYGLCGDEVQKHSKRKWLDIVTDVDHYMAIVGCSVGIICYVWIIFTYSFYKELQNLPSLNAMALCASLLLADLSFLVGVQTNKNANVCKIFAIFLHWSLMACLSWVTIIAFDLSIRFQSIKCVSEGRNFKLFRRYLIVAVSIPSLVIACTVTLDETHAVTIGYGNNKICWIGGFYALIGAYIVPASVGYVLTMVGLVYTLRTIRQDENKNKNILANSGRHNVNLIKIALKLACILGISEGLGFIQIHRTKLTENELIFNSIFGVAYGFSRSLRGVLLFIVYICNDKVFSLYRKTLKIQKNTESSSQKTGDIRLTSNTIT